MIDVKLIKDDQGGYDIGVEDGDLTHEDGFDTAIITSWFTDARAPESKVIIPENRRGWPGDVVSPVENRNLGGLIWLVEQRRLIQNTLNEIIDYGQKALNWFVEDEVAKKVIVTGVIVPRMGIALLGVITSFSGNVTKHYVPLWEVTGNAD